MYELLLSALVKRSVAPVAFWELLSCGEPTFKEGLNSTVDSFFYSPSFNFSYYYDYYYCSEAVYAIRFNNYSLD